MKKLLTLTTLVFTLMFSSTSFAEWTKMGVDGNGNTVYVDFERIQNVGGYFYWWVLVDHLEANEYGTLSSKSYSQVDCSLFRYQILTYSFHKDAMGEGVGDVSKPVEEMQGWLYPPPDSGQEFVLKTVCAYVKLGDSI